MPIYKARIEVELLIQADNRNIAKETAEEWRGATGAWGSEAAYIWSPDNRPRVIQLKRTSRNRLPEE